MDHQTTRHSGLRETLSAYGHPRVVTMLFLGFSAGLPLLLIFSSLSLWLRESGVSRSDVTYFSAAALGYSFKFIWAPIIDKMPLPVLTGLLGRRRAWLLLAQLAIITAILWMAFTDPAHSLTPMALAAVLLGFSSATQDIVIDAYRIESAEQRMQALMSATYIVGYRIGMLVAGAGALKLAYWFGSGGGYDYTAWRDAYCWMAGAMGVGVMTTLLISEPVLVQKESKYLNGLVDYLRFMLLFLVVVLVFVGVFIYCAPVIDQLRLGLVSIVGESVLTGFIAAVSRFALSLLCAGLAALGAIGLGVARREVVLDTYVAPVLDFFHRYGRLALLILTMVGFYRVSDIVLGVISNVFYQDMGFDKNQISNIANSFGLLMTIIGGLLGGSLALRYGVMRMLFIGAVLSAATNLLFMLLAQSGTNVTMLMVVIAADNLSAGLASAAFIAYLSGLTNISFTAFQYAIFSSLMTLFPKMLGMNSGSIVDAIGYSNFFLFTAALGIPVVLLVYLIGYYMPPEADS
jgi:MFS transporter, PAT family, beta-lactamase induction signal transducer AmpG